MTYLAVALVLVAALALGNLALTLALLNRLRGAGTAVPAPGPAPRITLAPGESPSGFDGVGSTLLVGFFSPGCEPCRERLPQFLAYARTTALPADRVLAVLVGSPAEVAASIDEVAGAARVTVEPPEGPLQQTFDVRGLPAMCLLDDAGVVLAAGTDLVTFPVAVAG